ncbi:MAG: hypothetical protein IPJ17_18185 [Holophagales bacterium]|nr:MAG: hypothetical protein IPJ17_18185 [Holophagales bacterium]
MRPRSLPAGVALPLDLARSQTPSGPAQHDSDPVIARYDGGAVRRRALQDESVNAGVTAIQERLIAESGLEILAPEV